MIAIAAFVFLQLGDWYGAVAFAVGLVAIMEHKFILFTGQTGKLFDKPKGERLNFVILLLCIWCGNFIGAFGVGRLLSLLPANAEIVTKATVVTGSLAAQGFFSLFVMSIFCGLLVYLATTCRNWLLTVLCVVAFVAGKFPHCIATMCYLGLTNGFLEVIWILLPVTLGNVFGSFLVPIWDLWLERKEPHLLPRY